MADVLETNQQIVLSVRIKGDAGPQTGDVVLGAANFGNFDPTLSYEPNEVVVKDGALYRATVTIDPGEFNPDQWEPLTDITFRLDDFQPNHSYTAGELCLYQQNLWRAERDFTSLNEFDPDDWFGIDTVDVCISDYQPDNAYETHEMVIHDGQLYRAKDSFTSTEAWKDSDWELISDLIVNDFAVNTDYQRNNLVIVSGALYRAKKDFTSSTTFDPNDWEKIGSSGIGNFSSGVYYTAGSLITYNNKLYVAKSDFTSGNSFDPNDWELQADTLAEDYAPFVPYNTDHLVYYNGALYRAKQDFTGDVNFDPSQWEAVNVNRLNDFQPDHSYLANEAIQHDGAIYVAKQDFTSSEEFAANDWIQLGAFTLQTIVANSSEDFTSVAEVRPTEPTLDIRYCAANSDSAVRTFTDNQAGRETISESVNLDQTSSVAMTVQRTATNHETANLSVTNLDAAVQLGLIQNGEDPYASLLIKDNQDQALELRVKQDDCAVNMSDQVSVAFTNALTHASAEQFGTVKLDGKTIQLRNEAITSYTVPVDYNSGDTYTENELVAYNNRFWVAKHPLTAEEEFNLNDWLPISSTMSQYTAGATYMAGDLVLVDGTIYYAKNNIPDAPAAIDFDNWQTFAPIASDIVYDDVNSSVAKAGNVQSAIDLLDTATSTLQTQLADLSEQVTSLSEQVTSLSNELTAINNNITELQTNLTTGLQAVNERIDNLTLETEVI